MKEFPANQKLSFSVRCSDMPMCPPTCQAGVNNCRVGQCAVNEDLGKISCECPTGEKLNFNDYQECSASTCEENNGGCDALTEICDQGPVLKQYLKLMQSLLT